MAAAVYLRLGRSRVLSAASGLRLLTWRGGIAGKLGDPYLLSRESFNRVPVVTLGAVAK